MSDIRTLLDQAAAAGKISSRKYSSAPPEKTDVPCALENILKWLDQPEYADYVSQIEQHVHKEQWQSLDDAFWKDLKFGTGGRRGRMYPIGCNAINDRTIGESAQGLAEYVVQYAKQQGIAKKLSCGIAYDTRHKSRHFAELCADVLIAAGLKVYLLGDYRSTPELSFLVCYKQCDCGIMVTASHNPPSDNAVKVYWSTGGQIVPPHDKEIVRRVESVKAIPRTGKTFDEHVAAGDIEICTQEVDAAFIAAVTRQKFAGPRDLAIVYSPLHGVGASAVCPALAADGFENVEIYPPHQEPSGDFPNVPGHVSNPENAEVFDAIIEYARKKADLVIATDPDCDRIGCAAPVSSGGDWTTFTGNQIGVLLADYILEKRKAAGLASPDHYLVTTLVTTGMLKRIGDSYGVKTYMDNLVGFKWIGRLMDLAGPEKFIYGTEESHGYLAGDHVRDKDGAVASMLLAELAAQEKAAGRTLYEKLESLWWQHGYHAERMASTMMEGAEGMTAMSKLMDRFRSDPPKTLAGLKVAAVRDYQQHVKTDIATGQQTPLPEPEFSDNLIFFDLAEAGNYVAIRPSGTEPKVKFYMFTFVPAEQLADLQTPQQEMSARLDAIAADLVAFKESVV